MKTLTLTAIEGIDHLVHPEDFTDITPESPALTIFTDFKEHQPLVLGNTISALQAANIMQGAHTNLRMIVDGNGEFLGTVCLQDLGEQHIMAQMTKGMRREDILVTDVMVPRSKIHAIDYQALRTAKVANVVATLQQSGKQYCLVVDFANHHIRGLISSSDIACRLHTAIAMSTPSNSLVDMYRAIKH